MATTIQSYEKDDVPEVFRIGYLRGVILDDRTFNFNGHTMWITDDVSDLDHVEKADLFVEEKEGN